MMVSIPRIVIPIICALLISGTVSQARWFVLPGLYYDWDLGWVGSLSAISENQRKERFTGTLAYFGLNEGLLQVSYFYPRSHYELTLEARYQAEDQEAYSSLQAAQQEEIFSALRRWGEVAVRCDFPRGDGFFYGLEGSYHRYDFGTDIAALTAQNLDPSLPDSYLGGWEGSAALRAGLERRDDRYNTSRGTYVLWQLAVGYTKSAQMEGQLVRAQIDCRQYWPLFTGSSVLALNLRGGVLHHQVPYFSRFKLGGSQSLRGFPLDRYSGNGYYLLRAEFRQQIKENMFTPLHLLKKVYDRLPDPRFTGGLVVFTDCGDLWRDDLGWWGFRQGIGVGLRAIFPPSVVASLDVAVPVDAQETAVYLNLQQSF